MMTFEESLEEVRRMWAMAISGDNFYIKIGQAETGEVPPKLGFAFHTERNRFVQQDLDATLAEYKILREALEEIAVFRSYPHSTDDRVGWHLTLEAEIAVKALAKVKDLEANR